MPPPARQLGGLPARHALPAASLHPPTPALHPERRWTTHHSVCEQCPAGTRVSADGRFCSMCPRGTSAPAGSAACAICPRDTISESGGTAACTRCGGTTPYSWVVPTPFTLRWGCRAHWPLRLDGLPACLPRASASALPSRLCRDYGINLFEIRPRTECFREQCPIYVRCGAAGWRGAPTRLWGAWPHGSACRLTCPPSRPAHRDPMRPVTRDGKLFCCFTAANCRTAAARDRRVSGQRVRRGLGASASVAWANASHAACRLLKSPPCPALRRSTLRHALPPHPAGTRTSPGQSCPRPSRRTPAGFDRRRFLGSRCRSKTMTHGFVISFSAVTKPTLHPIHSLYCRAIQGTPLGLAQFVAHMHACSHRLTVRLVPPLAISNTCSCLHPSPTFSVSSCSCAAIDCETQQTRAGPGRPGRHARSGNVWR